MKQQILSTLLSAALLSTAFSASAIIAKRGVQIVTQADGTELSVKLTGDERHHYYTTEDDYLLVEKSGNFYFATTDASGKIVNSNRRATDAMLRSSSDETFLSKLDSKAMASAYMAQMKAANPNRMQRTAPADGYPQGPGLFPGTSFPAHGVQKGLVILVQYTDVQFNSSYYNGYDGPRDYFEKMLNQDGWSKHGGTGSAREWFVSNSSGIFLPDFDVYGPVTLAHNMSYYGGNDYWGNDQRPEEMVIEACQALNSTVNFADYDRDNDGYIDNVYVFYAGRGEADGGGANTVWPHSWEVSSATSTPYYFDGVRLDRYACSNERDASKPDGIGTFCHEFSHVMGLPDEYSTTYTNAFTPGAWSPMDYGPYNNDGRTPPVYSAFNRYALGWVEPIVIDHRMNGSLDHIMDSGKCYIVKTSKENEYFMFENRQQEGWDAYIPGHGMLIWHIDYDSSVWNSNSPNNTSSHQHIDIEEADGSQSEYSRDGDPFPGTSHKTSFTDTTNPSMKTWANKALNLPITDIAESNGVITFKVLGGIVDVATPVLNEATDVAAEQFSVSWSEVEDATNYLVTLKHDLTATVQAAVPGYDNLNVGLETSYTFTGLTPETTYYLTVVAENSGCYSQPSEVLVVTTTPPRFEDSQMVLADPTEISHNSFVMNWKENPDATEYFVNVYDKNVEDINEVTVNFDDGIAGMGRGWITTSNATYSNAANCGQAPPALKLSADGQYVSTPLYDDDIYTFKFWHRGASSTSDNTLSALGLVNGVWVNLQYFDIVNTSGGKIYEIEEIPENTRQIKIQYNKPGKGYVAIDDIELTWGGTWILTPIGEYADYSAGTANSLLIEGLSPLTTYYYTVHASNGEVLNRKAREACVTTLDEPSSVSSILTDNCGLTVDGRKVSVTAPAGSMVTVCDVTGRVVARKVVGYNGVANMILPGSGLYIINSGNKVSKLVVK